MRNLKVAPLRCEERANIIPRATQTALRTEQGGPWRRPGQTRKATLFPDTASRAPRDGTKGLK
eukprot:4515697-Pyramimonas_sp.AAC.1